MGGVWSVPWFFHLRYYVWACDGSFSNNIVHVSTSCGSKSIINLSAFTWEYICGFALNLYTIVCVPLNTPTVLHVNHHRAARDGWNSDSLYDGCSDEYRLTIQPFVGNCTSDRSCGCNVCLRQPHSLRNLVPQTVFNITFNISSFTLIGRSLYHHYLYTVESFPTIGWLLSNFTAWHFTAWHVLSWGTNDMQSVNDFAMTV